MFQRIAVVVLLFVTGSVSANSGRFYFENDLFGGSDRYFTNAVRLSVAHKPDTHPSWVAALGADKVPGYKLMPGDEVESTTVGYFASHYMYTASDIAVSNPSLADRPYFGWLNIGVSASRVLTTDQFQVAWVALGVTGPSAKADQLQSWVHEWRDIGKPQGWDTQAGDEPSLDFSFEHRWRATLWGIDEGESEPLLFLGLPTRRDHNYIDLLPRVGVNLGTTFDQLRLGGQLRLGWNLPDNFGAAVMEPTDRRGGEAQPNGWNAYGFFDIEGRIVARNASLDGPLYRDGRSVDKEPVVGEFRYGVVLDSPWGISLTYVFVQRTHEFKAQEFDQSFGSVQVGWQL